jgi:hypothetical protein
MIDGGQWSVEVQMFAVICFKSGMADAKTQGMNDEGGVV